ncbi:MAG: hypothetical protein ABIB11_01095 [Candidatus Omnitrophota bacterium]
MFSICLKSISKNLFVSLIIILLIAGCVSSFLLYSNKWQFAGWYGGGTFPSVVFDPNIKDRLYLVSDIAGIWRSDNGGNNWISINRGLGNLNVSFVVPAPSDPNVLIAATADGLYCSRNSGKSWSLCNLPGETMSFVRPHNYRSIAISKYNAEHIIAGTKNGKFFLSNNCGKSFKHIRPPRYSFGGEDYVSCIKFSKDEEGVFVAMHKKLYYYSIKKDLWDILYYSDFSITDFYISGDEKTLYLAGNSALLISEDRGKNWNISKEIPKGIVYRVAVAQTDRLESIIVASKNKGWGGGVFISKDNGNNWIEGKNSFEFDKRLNPTRIWKRGGEAFLSLKIDPFDSSRLFATSDWGVFMSNDGGDHWKEMINGAFNVSGSDLRITKTGVIYVAAMDNGLLKSENFGGSYSPLFPKNGYDKNVNGHVWRVLSHPYNPKKIIATSSPWNASVNQIIISSDGGNTFEISRKGLPKKRPTKNTMWGEGYPRALAFNPLIPQIMYLGIDGDDGGGLFVSYDGAKTWKRTRGQPKSKRIYNALCVDPHYPKRIFWGAYGENGGIYISSDGGDSWARARCRIKKVFDIKMNSNGWVFAAGDYNGPCVFVSKNRGKTWGLLKRFGKVGAAEALFIHPYNPNVIAVSTVKWHNAAGGRIYFTENSGIAWKDITCNLPESSGFAAIDYNPKDNSLYVISYNGSVFKRKLGKDYRI